MYSIREVLIIILLNHRCTTIIRVCTPILITGNTFDPSKGLKPNRAIVRGYQHLQNIL